MQPASRAKIAELHRLISKMPIRECCVSVLPLFGMRWKEMSQAVRNSRLPMQPASVARVLSRHAAGALADEEVDDVLVVLRLKFATIKQRQWHVVTLLEPIDEDMSAMQLLHDLPVRVTRELTGSRAGRNMRPDVTTTLLDDLVYISVQLVSPTRAGPVLYVAAPPGEPVALVSTLGSKLLPAAVVGLGYKTYEDANLFGPDINSLLRIHNRVSTDNVEHLVSLPSYNPQPVVSNTGIDYTNTSYDLNYVDNIIGPDPPLLTDLKITSSKPFFDPSRLKKDIPIRIQLKSQDVAKTLRSWVEKKALAPTSEFFQIFHRIKSNEIEFNNDE